MLVKYDERGEVVSFFVNCIPDDVTGFVEIPDDEAVVKAFIEKHKAQQEATPTPEERIDALEEQLAAAKILLGVE